MDMCLKLLIAVVVLLQLCSAVLTETEKLGRCPSKGLLESSQCIDNLLDECAVDSDCEGSAKCCSTGCKRACVLPDFSTCQRIHVEFQKRARALGLDVETLAPPRCQPTGTFEPVQCNGTACWCVDKSGFEVAGTRARSLDLVDCKSPRPCAGFNCRMLCPYEFELDKDGCPLCQCRDPCRGIKCPGSQSCQLEEVPCEKEPCAPLPTCKQARSLDSLCPLGLPMTLPGGDKPYLCGLEAGKPTCPKQFDCHVSPGADYGVCCASVERLNKPGECPLSGPAECGVPCGKDIDCSGADKCCGSAGCGKTCMPPQNLTVCRQHQAFTELLTLHEREGRGYIPQCTPEGNFDLRQCSRNGLVCWCVNAQNGAQIRGSIGPSSSVRCDDQSESSGETGRADCGLTMCPRTCQYGYKLNENGCQTCDCEDPCVNFKCPEGSKCEKVPEDGCDGSRCPVKPQCGPVFIEPCSQGPHLKNDVTGLPVKCTVGSKFSCPSGYNCIESFMHKTSFCCPKKEEQKERDDSEMMPTVCQIMKRMSEENGRSLAENGMEMTIKSPKCTPTGEFDSLQCQDDFCWCVDEFGVEVARSRGPRTPNRDCKRSRNDVDCQGSSMCRLGCDFGFVMDDDSGCPKCECRNPCDSVTCEEGKTCQVVPAPCEEADCPKLPFCLDVSRRSAEVDSTEDSLSDLVCPGGNPEEKLKTCRVRGRSLDDCHDGFGCYSNSSVEGSLGICCPIASQVPAKIGQCPFGTPIGSSCDIECATDLDCDGMTKCCSNGCGTQCVIPLLKTACGMEKDVISNRAKESGIPANRIYAPDCDTEGEYKQIQCHPGTRVCWCVDSVGRELAGTRSPPGIRPTCDLRALSEVCDPFDCDLDCPFGNALDSAGCPVCKCKDPCEKVRCGDDESCKVVELNCVSGPCPPLPICVPLKEKICSSGTSLKASDGHEVQCGPLGVSCPSSHKCNLSPFGDYAVCCQKPREACAQPLLTGFCNSSLPRWHFNTKSNRCEPFTFSGCGSNLNNFESEQHCKATCPVQTSCEKLREKNLRLLEKYKKVVFLPKCKEGGEFETVQCLDELGICWCVDKHGEPVKGTLTRGKPICSVRQARQHSIDKMICEEGVTVHVCDKSLCDNKVCIADPTARCKINACGGCKIEFYDARGSTVDCANGLTKCQNHIQEVVNSPNWYRQDLEYGQNRDAEILPNFYTDYIRSSQSVVETSEGQDSALRHRRQAGMFDLSDIDDQIYDLVAMESQDSHSEFPQVLSVDGVPVENPPASIDAMPEFSSEVESLMDGMKIRYIGDAIKAGECPAVRQPSFLRLLAQVSNQCVDHCVSDADCPGQLRCCPGQCGHACQLPILPKAPVTKPGQCPFAQRVCKDQSEKRSTCRRDWDCPADGKCCDTGCGSVCLQPEETQVKPSVLYLLPPRCTEAGEYSSEQRQGDLSWCVTEDGSPVQGSLTRGFVRCSSNGTVVERLSLGPVCPSADQAPKVCSTECLQASCPGHPDAVCVADPCNGCKTSFYTLEGEQVSCEPVCTQRKQVGNCRASFPRWHFNTDSRTCEEFYFGGCGGNDNNFQSREECQEKCKAVDRCSLPTNVGTCGKQVKRWSFNAAEQKCQEFIFTGCGGNANNFITKAECEMTCPDLVMCPKLPDTAGEMSVCSRSEVCEEEGCPDEDVVCTVDPCTCAPVYRNRKGEKVECKRYHEEEENFLSDAASSSDILARNAQTPPPMKVLPADVATETEEEKQIRDKSKSVETEVIKMHNPAQEFISRMGEKSAVKPLKKKKAKSMALHDVKVVTRCQKMRQRMAEEKSSFVVDCDKSGRFAPTQCYMGTPAVCWCVDESGNQLKDTTMFMSGNRTCHYVPVKGVRVSLAIPMHEDDHPETDLIQKQIDSMLSELNAQIELKAAGMNNDHMVRVNFTLIGDNKIDVADYLEEMVRNGELELQMGDNIMPADFTSSRFVHIAGAPVIRQQRKLDTSLDNREIIAEAIDYEIPYFAIVVTMCVVSSVVICALILSLVLYRKKTTGEYPKGRRVPLAYGSYHSGGGKKEDVVPRGFPRVGLDEKDFASIKVKPLSPVLPRFMRNGNTESMKL